MGTVTKAVGPLDDRVTVGDDHPGEGWIVLAADGDQRTKDGMAYMIAGSLQVVREA